MLWSVASQLLGFLLICCLLCFTICCKLTPCISLFRIFFSGIQHRFCRLSLQTDHHPVGKVALALALLGIVILAPAGLTSEGPFVSLNFRNSFIYDLKVHSCFRIGQCCIMFAKCLHSLPKYQRISLLDLRALLALDLLCTCEVNTIHGEKPSSGNNDALC